MAAATMMPVRYWLALRSRLIMPSSVGMICLPRALTPSTAVPPWVSMSSSGSPAVGTRGIGSLDSRIVTLGAR